MLPSATDDNKRDTNLTCTDLVLRRDFSVVRRNFWSLHPESSEEPSSQSCEYSSDSEIDLSINDESYLLSLDPKNWKEQDHYRVLGVGHLRYKATENDIKKAFKKKVLKHHPDKRRNAGEDVKELDDDYFTCITKANEILTNQTKRRAYDSVDPLFNDDIPVVSSQSREKFFEVFSNIFRKNARWSYKQPVPRLGTNKSTLEEVNEFYSFWYNFESWREYSYLDEEEKEKGENREERRWIEKQNKAARLRRKKEEVARIRTLVDNAYSCDPRIQRFKEEERQKKLAQKQAKKDAARAKADIEEKQRLAILETERLKRELEDEEARLQAAEVKKEKEVLKRALKKEKKTLRTLCKDNNYYGRNDAEVVKNMQEIDKICERFSLERLQALNEQLISGDEDKCRQAFIAQVQIMNDELEKEKDEMLAASHKNASGDGVLHSSKNWSPEDLQLLIKAVNLFPAGTGSRWDVVASFINHHSTNGQIKTAKDVINKTKDLKKLDSSIKAEANKNAYSKFEKAQRNPNTETESLPSQRFDSPAEQQGFNPAPWTTEEQKLLEQALKTYSTAESERWDKIAACIPGRNKKDCMKRYKDLVELVKAKKAAQAEVTKSKK